MQPSLDQAFQLLSIIRESGASLERVQNNIVNSGFLTDLLKVENIDRVDREALRLALGYEPSIFKIEMGGREDAKEAIESARQCGFRFNPMINHVNFPFAARAERRIEEIELFTPGFAFTIHQGLALLKSAGLDRPTYEHPLRYVRQYGGITSDKTPKIVFLHEPWHDLEGRPRIICVERSSRNAKNVHLITTRRIVGTLAGIRRKSRVIAMSK